ncbi:hypothetical protein V6243_04465 [Cobetia marina]|uniref:Uncharacterized protein n=1 Tax=Cobetia marina TaxID=28258 RepID=A0ABU9GDA3_COBMA
MAKYYFLLADRCARAAKEPLATWPLLTLAVLLWMRAAALVVMGVLELAFDLDMVLSNCWFASSAIYPA